ncbi:MAG: acyl-CoA dehydrogenase [Mycobacterium sp.]|nr:acyl-CoA dehydrogenase [Mycobacterium sp.]
MTTPSATTPATSAIEPLIEAVHDLLSTTCTHAALQAAEQEGWAGDIWRSVSDMGLPWISVPESAGGQGGTLLEALSVLRVAGRYGLPLPLAETGILGGWLLSGAGLTLPGGPITVAPGCPADRLQVSDGRVSGVLHAVPWARAVDHVVALVDRGGACTVLQLPRESLRIEPLTNVAGEPRDTVHADHVRLEVAAPAAAGVDGAALRRRGALSRVMLIAGALEGTRDLTVSYTNERIQFGRPVARFQAVQQHLVHIAQQVALMGMAADTAAREFAAGRGEFEVAAAKTLAGEAVHVATRAAHQAHGAMGMTQEYALHQLTRRLWAWRREFGDAAEWAARVGRQVSENGADALYPLIADGSRL